MIDHEATDADIVEAWHERAAIREFDGDERQELAEMRAAIGVRKMIAPRKLPGEIVEAVRREGS